MLWIWVYIAIECLEFIFNVLNFNERYHIGNAILFIVILAILMRWYVWGCECAGTEGGRVVEVEEFSSSAGLARNLYGVVAHTHVDTYFVLSLLSLISK